MKTERDAGTILVAMYRTWRREGIAVLTDTEIADRAGYTAPGRLSILALELLVAKGWLEQHESGFTLTGSGRARAEELI